MTRGSGKGESSISPGHLFLLSFGHKKHPLQKKESSLAMKIARQVPLHDKNWFRTGGAAAWYAEPQTPQEFADAIAFAHTEKLPIFPLGQGANILIADTGFTVICLSATILRCSVS